MKDKTVGHIFVFRTVNQIGKANQLNKETKLNSISFVPDVLEIKEIGGENDAYTISFSSDKEVYNKSFIKMLPSGYQILIKDQITYHHSLENNLLILCVTFLHQRHLFD